MRTCRDAVDLLMDYLEGRLPAEEAQALDAHLDGCPPCQAFLRTYRETPDLLREATDVPIPDEVCRRLEAFLKSRRRG